MSSNEPGSAPQTPGLTALPRLEEIPAVPGGGLDPMSGAPSEVPQEQLDELAIRIVKPA